MQIDEKHNQAIAQGFQRYQEGQKEKQIKMLSFFLQQKKNRHKIVRLFARIYSNIVLTTSL